MTGCNPLFFKFHHDITKVFPFCAACMFLRTKMVEKHYIMFMIIYLIVKLFSHQEDLELASPNSKLGI